VLLAFCISFPVCGAGRQEGSLTWRRNGQTAMVTGLAGKALEGLAVTAIGDNAFKGRNVAFPGIRLTPGDRPMPERR
ncbi:MAG: hypothetical protein LBC88_02805, partial [Spirochaetaceae bacterium]|nr:hypothetical protein [Spirochaetaceae bacterium]